MKILFIPNLPYTYRDHIRFGVKYFADKGYDVEIMDIHKVLIPGYKERVPIEYFSPPEHWEVENIEEIVNRVQQLSKNDYIFFYIAGSKAINLLNLMKKNSPAKFLTYVGGAIPTSTVFCKYSNQIKFVLKNIIKKILPSYNQYFETDLFVSGSPKDEYTFPNLITKTTKLIKSNSRDYNQCLTSIPYISPKKYCVFLDTDVIDASDYILFGDQSKKNIAEYLKKLLYFFKWIEDKFDVQVIIAAHPKSRLYKDKTSIEGIEIIHGKSVELVQGSEFVINEGTTAISYAIFFNKPLIFFTFNTIDFFYQHCCVFAKELDKKIINSDDLDEDLFKMELNNMSRYAYYKMNYLTYEDKKIDTFELIENEFNGR